MLLHNEGSPGGFEPTDVIQSEACPERSEWVEGSPFSRAEIV
jgi:hypothetical protein